MLLVQTMLCIKGGESPCSSNLSCSMAQQCFWPNYRIEETVFCLFTTSGMAAKITQSEVLPIAEVLATIEFCHRASGRVSRYFQLQLSRNTDLTRSPSRFSGRGNSVKIAKSYIELAGINESRDFGSPNFIRMDD